MIIIRSYSLTTRPSTILNELIIFSFATNIQRGTFLPFWRIIAISLKTHSAPCARHVFTGGNTKKKLRQRMRRIL